MLVKDAALLWDITTRQVSSLCVGGDVEYSIGRMKLNLCVEYAADIATKPGDDGSYNYDRDGFNIVPSVSFSW